MDLLLLIRNRLRGLNYSNNEVSMLKLIVDIPNTIICSTIEYFSTPFFSQETIELISGFYIGVLIGTSIAIIIIKNNLFILAI